MDVSAQLQEVRAKLAQLDPMDRNNMAEIAHLKAQEAELAKQADAEEELRRRVKESLEQKEAEIQELVLGYNFNEVFGDPEANKLIHGILMAEVQKYEERITGLYREIEQVNHVSITAKEEASEKSAEVDRLQSELEASNAKLSELEGAEDRVIGLKKIIEEKDKEISDLKTRLDEELKESRYYRNESAKQELELRKLRTENEEMRKSRTLDKDAKPNEVAQRIMQRTHEKRKLANVRTNEDGSITGTDAEGSEVTVPWFAKNSIEAVDTFPEATSENGTDDTTDNSLTLGVEPIEVPTFQITPNHETHDATAGLAGGELGGEVEDGATEERTIEERVAELEQWRKYIDILLQTEERVAV